MAEIKYINYYLNISLFKLVLDITYVGELMKKEKKKLKKFNSFDLLDAEILEEYLSKMALEGWIISHIGSTFLTFEKTTPKVIKFFADITTKDLVGDNYIPTTDYINSFKAKGLEYVCGNEDFQIFINNGAKGTLERRTLKFTRVFMNGFFQLISIIFIFMSLLLNDNSFLHDSFITFISDKYFILWMISGVIIVVLNLLSTILKIFKYIKVVKVNNDNFAHRRNFKIRDILSKVINSNFILFLMTLSITLLNPNGDLGKYTSKNELPMSLEDFDVEIQDLRQCDFEKTSSPFAKYMYGTDNTYKEVVRKVYDKESNSYYDEYSEEHSASLSYTVFQSKYDKIINKALDSILRSYDEFDLDYEKLNDAQELKKWGAKEIYIINTWDEKVIVYSDKILKISGDIEYNEKNIDTIKDKVLNGVNF